MIGENIHLNIRMIAMEKDCYQEIIAEVSKKLAEKFISAEKNLAARSTLIDSDILEIVRDIGLQTTRNVLENTRDEITVKKKKLTDWQFIEIRSLTLIRFSESWKSTLLICGQKEFAQSL